MTIAVAKVGNGGVVIGDGGVGVGIGVSRRWCWLVWRRGTWWQAWRLASWSEEGGRSSHFVDSAAPNSGHLTPILPRFNSIHFDLTIPSPPHFLPQ